MARNFKGKGKPGSNQNNRYSKANRGRGQSSQGSTNYKNKRYDDDDARSQSKGRYCDSSGKSFEAKDGANDISWYSRYPEILAGTASIPYPYRPGMGLPLGGVVQGYPNINIPGVMSIPWMPTTGYSVTSTDPASVVAKQIYSQVRKSYSGSLEADAPDFVIYLMSLSSVFSYIAWLKRVYRCTTAYTPNNYAMPDTLLRAMGFTQNQCNALRIEKTQLWTGINTLIYSSRKFTCPAVMDIINRHYWLSDNIYADANSINSQFYLFNPMAFYVFTQFAKTPAGVDVGGLSYKPLDFSTSSTSSLVEDLIKFGMDMIERLVAWDESYTISGYLMRAYEGAPQFVVELLGQDEVLTPVYNEEVLTQIENVRGIYQCSNFSFFQSVQSEAPAVTQDPLTNTIINPMSFLTNVSKTYLNAAQDIARCSNLISIRNDLPTVADTVIATRMTNGYEYSLAQESDSTLTVRVYAATEIVGNPTVYLVDTNAAGAINGIVTNLSVIIGTSSASSTYVNTINAMCIMQQFDWNPGTLVLTMGSTGDVTGAYYAKDMHNITTLSNTQLDDIHRVCLYSEFNAFNF